MAMVFALIISDVGTEQTVVAALQAIEAIKATYRTYGVYDILAKIVAPTLEEIKTTIFAQIRSVPGVQNMLTLVVVESDS